MSSTPSPVSLSNSQTATGFGEQQDTPNTTPPIGSNSHTPVPEIDMEDSSEPNEHNEQRKDPEENEENDEEMADLDGDDDENEKEEELLTLPLLKIKKIFRMDPDYLAASKSAVYATGLATELFVQYFAEQASVLTKMGRRKKIQYKDFSEAVQMQDSLYFLSDTVPPTHKLSELIHKKKIDVNGSEENIIEQQELPAVEREEKTSVRELKKTKPLEKGQQTLNFSTAPPLASDSSTKKAVIDDIVIPVQDD